MSQINFSLIPGNVADAPKITITGHIARQHNHLDIQYLLAGDTANVIIPTAKSPQRRYDLWDHTCFEFFLGIQNQPGYWEFNLAPSLDWNVFRLTDYRQGIAEELKLDSLSFSILQNDFFQLSLTVDLAELIDTPAKLEVGIASVVEDSQHQLSYWALKHPAATADFHARDSWAIAI